MQLGLRPIVAEVRAGGLLQSAFEAIEAWQLPLRSWGDFSALPLMRAAAARGVKTILGGDGGDELFAVRGYLLADRLREGHPREALALVDELPGAAARPGRRRRVGMAYEMAILGALPERLHGWARARSPQARGAVVAAAGPRARPPGLARTIGVEAAGRPAMVGPRGARAHARHRGERRLRAPDDRRRSELAGLEARHPLLDFDLVELCLSLAPLASFDPHANRPLLRAAMAGVLPDAVRRRPRKALFDTLLVDCLEGPDYAVIRRLLEDPRCELRAYVDLGALRRTLFESDRLRRAEPFRWMWHVWRLATAECWLRSQSGSGFAAGASPARVSLRTGVRSAPKPDSYVFPP